MEKDFLQSINKKQRQINKDRAHMLAVEYVHNGCDIVKAMIAKGYKESYALRNYKKISDNIHFKDAISRLTSKIELKTDVTISEIVSELKKLGFEDSTINKSDKLKALELLGKYKAMFTDKSIVSNELPPELKQEEKEALEEASRQAAIKLSKTGTEG